MKRGWEKLRGMECRFPKCWLQDTKKEEKNVEKMQMWPNKKIKAQKLLNNYI